MRICTAGLDQIGYHQYSCKYSLGYDACKSEQPHKKIDSVIINFLVELSPLFSGELSWLNALANLLSFIIVFVDSLFLFLEIYLVVFWVFGLKLMRHCFWSVHCGMGKVSCICSWWIGMDYVEVVVPYKPGTFTSLVTSVGGGAVQFSVFLTVWSGGGALVFLDVCDIWFQNFSCRQKIIINRTIFIILISIAMIYFSFVYGILGNISLEIFLWIRFQRLNEFICQG